MAQYAGNAIPAPTFRPGDTVGREEELLYSTQGYTQKGVTLAPGQGVLKSGTFLYQDATSKQYKKALAANAADIFGCLRQTTDTGADSSATARVYQGNAVIMGILKLDLINAANAAVDVTAAVTALGATQNAARNTFKF